MKISSKEVKKIIPSGSKAILDREYNLPTDEEVLVHLQKFEQKPGFEANKRDCDNFAIELLAWFSGKGWPFALAILKGHAANLYINDNRELKFIEPQTGRIFTPTKRLKITVMP